MNLSAESRFYCIYCGSLAVTFFVNHFHANVSAYLFRITNILIYLIFITVEWTRGGKYITHKHECVTLHKETFSHVIYRGIWAVQHRFPIYVWTSIIIFLYLFPIVTCASLEHGFSKVKC